VPGAPPSCPAAASSPCVDLPAVAAAGSRPASR
jgi:hypothetical protein